MAERRRGRRFEDQLRPFVPLAIVWSIGVALLAVALGQGVIRHEDLLLDPVSSGNLPWYTGLISQLGAIVWCVAVCAAVAGAVVARLGARAGAVRFLLGAAGVGTLMLIDDMFLLHSNLLPRLFGVSKIVVLATYAALIVVWVGTNLREIGRTRVQLLLAAGGALGASVVADRFGLALWMEDGAKVLGILAWATYLTATAIDIMRSVVVTSKVPAAAN